MKAIGITGGIGAGKSIVSRIFQTLGISVYDADVRARQIMNNSQEVVRAVKDLFGEDSYASGQLNRALVAQVAFHDPAKLEALNAIVHPAVAADFERWLHVQTGPYVLKEAALLFETGSYKELQGVIVVDAPEKTRVKRVLQRDPYRDEKQIQAIMNKQMDSQQKSKMADYIITNDGKVPVIPQVLDLHQRLST